MNMNLNKRHGRAAVLAVLGLLSSATAMACTEQRYAGASIGLTIDAWDDVEPDKVIASWTWDGNATFLAGCGFDDIPFDITPSLAGLEFVRNVMVDGQVYPAFGLTAYPRSPLLIFKHLIWPGISGIPEVEAPLDVRKVNHVSSGPMVSLHRGSIVHIAAVSRGGIMQPVPTTLLGPISRVSPLYPMWVKTDTFTVTANLKVPTCSFADTAFTLKDVAAADLPAADTAAGEETFNVEMNCNGQFPVTMKLTDANAAGNTGSRLTPTGNATAGSVRVQLLREGAPVVLGQTWSIAQSQMGNQNIALSARYYREAGTFHAGVVEGQAVIEATYR